MTWGYVAVGVGTAAAGYMGSKASKDAADAQSKAAGSGIDAELQMFREGQDATAPWRDSGTQALGALGDIYGTTGYLSQSQNEHNQARNDLASQIEGLRAEGASAEEISQLEGQLSGMEPDYVASGADPYDSFFSMQDKLRGGFESSPGKAYQLEQAELAARKQLNAQGLSGSGAEMKELMRMAQGQAQQEWGNYVGQFGNYTNALRSMAGQGQTSAGQTASMATGVGQSMNSNYMAQGAAAAQADIQQANVWSNTMGQGAQAFGGYMGERDAKNKQNSAIQANLSRYSANQQQQAPSSAYGMRPASQIPVETIAQEYLWLTECQTLKYKCLILLAGI